MLPVIRVTVSTWNASDSAVVAEVIPADDGLATGITMRRLFVTFAASIRYE
jgi:hypothetical protein